MTLLRSLVWAALSLSTGCGSAPGSAEAGETGPFPDDLGQRLEALTLPDQVQLPGDATNAYADDRAAAELGKQFFFDPRFSGPLLDESNVGSRETLGSEGDTGRVACAGCHEPEKRFEDTRSPREQLSLASGWTTRRTPTLLDFAQTRFLGWDGRRDTSYGSVFGVIDNSREFNSSRLFVAQQIASLYADEYERVFGGLPDLDDYAVLAPEDAGCSSLSAEREQCQSLGHDDDAVIRVVVNFGKAIAAYLRQLTCGPSRFDAWVRGDRQALSESEGRGAEVFVRSGCDACHSGPFFTDHGFHNVGTPGGLVPFTGVDTTDDPGAAVGLSDALEDPLGSLGEYSDGSDDRWDSAAADPAELLGAFRTPSLRCMSGRPAFMHNGEYRSLHDVVRLFDRGGAQSGFVGTAEIEPLGLDDDELDDLVAFLLALDGPGPEPELLVPPALPQD